MIGMNWLGLIIGAAIGGLLGWVFRCSGGTCPITSQWYIPVIIGGLFGLTWTMSPRGKMNGDSGTESNDAQVDN